MLNQRLQQKLQQKLSPQQILLMKLLQVPVIDLEQRIKQEIEENPALEDLRDPDEEPAADQGRDGWEEEEDGKEEEPQITEKDIDLTEYLDEDDTPSYMLRNPNSGPSEDKPGIPFAADASFQDFLISQLGLRKLSERQYEIGLTLIGNLDDFGYLRREIPAIANDLAFTMNLYVEEQEIREVLAVIQELDPPGIGATDLRECLLLQLHRSEDNGNATQNAILILSKYFEEFSRKHFDKIQKKSRLSEKDLREALAVILRLNPKPGNAYGADSRGAQYVIPDFSINNIDGTLELSINSRNIPDLRVNRSYLEMAESYALEKNKNSHHRDALIYLKQKIDSARWFIEALRQRENTLFFTMKAIMDYQERFFLTGDETQLRPMILKDIAEIVKLDISTISRVANSKYVQTPYGTFSLKYFFSESLQTDSGEEVSSREIKKILEDCIGAENKEEPLTDEELTLILKEKGYNIARRTVAKYREQLGIPVARMRRAL